MLWKLFRYIFRIFIHPYEYELFGTLTGNLVICKFKTYYSTRRTICFIQSCHVRSRNTVPFITVKINSNSEGKVASCNVKRMKNKINCRINFQHRNYFCLLLLWVLNPGNLNNKVLTLKNKMQKYNLCPAIIYWFLCDHSRRFTWCRGQLSNIKTHTTPIPISGDPQISWYPLDHKLHCVLLFCSINVKQTSKGLSPRLLDKMILKRQVNCSKCSKHSIV